MKRLFSFGSVPQRHISTLRLFPERISRTTTYHNIFCRETTKFVYPVFAFFQAFTLMMGQRHVFCIWIGSPACLSMKRKIVLNNLQPPANDSHERDPCHTNKRASLFFLKCGNKTNRMNSPPDVSRPIHSLCGPAV